MKYTPQGTPMLIADDLFAKAKALYAEANLPPGHPDLLKLNVVYADILYKMGEKRESIMVHDRALKALDEAKSSSGQ
jgi:hypothetical protein